APFAVAVADGEAVDAGRIQSQRRYGDHRAARAAVERGDVGDPVACVAAGFGCGEAAVDAGVQLECYPLVVCAGGHPDLAADGTSRSINTGLYRAFGQRPCRAVICVVAG